MNGKIIISSFTKSVLEFICPKYKYLARDEDDFDGLQAYEEEPEKENNFDGAWDTYGGDSISLRFIQDNLPFIKWSDEKPWRIKEDILDVAIVINEHFDNTAGFIFFKLHSDSTLNTFKKSELIDYIHTVYHNWQCADSGYNNVMKYAEGLQKRIDELELKEKQWIETEKDYRDELKKLKSNPPLRFEELEIGMWVWDNKWKTYYTIRKFRGKNIYARYGRFVVDPYTDEQKVDNGWMGTFEENRFFRQQTS